MGAVQQAMLMASGGVVLTDHFETVLYTGDATYPRVISTTIDPRIGMVWGKARATAAHTVFLPTNLVTPTYNYGDIAVDTTASNENVTIATSSITLTTNAAPANRLNTNATNFVLWLFKNINPFLDVVTYTGNGSTQNIAHGLGVAPGFIIVKRTSGATSSWCVYHRSRSTTNRYFQFANDTAESTSANVFSADPTSTQFSIGSDSSVNQAGQTFTAFVFGHDTDPSGLIQCGSYTGNASTSGPNISLGWNPRWLMVKRRDALGNWNIADAARTTGFTGNEETIRANQQSLVTIDNWVALTGSGFQLVSADAQYNASGATFIYVAIR